MRSAGFSPTRLLPLPPPGRRPHPQGLLPFKKEVNRKVLWGPWDVRLSCSLVAHSQQPECLLWGSLLTSRRVTACAWSKAPARCLAGRPCRDWAQHCSDLPALGRREVGSLEPLVKMWCLGHISNAGSLQSCPRNVWADVSNHCAFWPTGASTKNQSACGIGTVWAQPLPISPNLPVLPGQEKLQETDLLSRRLTECPARLEQAGAGWPPSLCFWGDAGSALGTDLMARVSNELVLLRQGFKFKRGPGSSGGAPGWCVWGTGLCGSGPVCARSLQNENNRECKPQTRGQLASVLTFSCSH